MQSESADIDYLSASTWARRFLIAPLNSHHATDPFTPLSYDQEHKDMQEALKAAGLVTGSITHLPRKVLTRWLSDRGVPEHEIAALGVWEAVNTMRERYMNGLPWQAITVAAGFELGGSCGLHRDRPVPGDLSQKVSHRGIIWVTVHGVGSLIDYRVTTI